MTDNTTSCSLDATSSLQIDHTYIKPELVLLDGDEGDGKVQANSELVNGTFVNGAFADIGPS